MASTDTTTAAAAATTTTTTNACAACGKEGPTNTCNKCNMVKYCNAACKKKHRSKHKKACERRVTELHDEELFKEHPPTDDCPICFLTLPLDTFQKAFKTCCGKVICCGCIYAMGEEARGRGKIKLCAFCRVPYPSSHEENIKRLKKLMEAKNAIGYHQLAGNYQHGNGVPQDFAKANELCFRAGELGCAAGYFNLGNSYHNGRGVEADKTKANHYYELAAMNGDVYARYSLGLLELEAGNQQKACKHFILAAKAGHKDSLCNVKVGFMRGLLTKDEYENTLRAHQSRHDEMKSEDRDKALALINDGVMML